MFTTNRTWTEAANDFFNWRPPAEQPIEFPHDVHIARKIRCTVCHRGVEKGPVAGLPGVKACMQCHTRIAADRPRIREIAAMRAKGIDLAWQRVYGFATDDHVKFNHAPHVRANVDCATCHGDLSTQTVAQRAVEHTMGFCVSCHNARKASVDCVTCHF